MSPSPTALIPALSPPSAAPPALSEDDFPMLPSRPPSPKDSQQPAIESVKPVGKTGKKGVKRGKGKAKSSRKQPQPSPPRDLPAAPANVPPNAPPDTLHGIVHDGRDWTPNDWAHTIPPDQAPVYDYGGSSLSTPSKDPALGDLSHLALLAGPQMAESWRDVQNGKSALQPDALCSLRDGH